MLFPEVTAVDLARCESEDDVISILKKVQLWENKKYWKPFGGNENNFSIIGNQQSAPDAALVEKIINSVDAVLLKECLVRGIDPESPAAPQSISEALQKFFGIRDGKLSNLDTKQRNQMSYDIMMIATGSRQNPNYTIIDKGEGQTPQKMPDTILSLSKSNKLRIPFVQGKFNMGGTGVLQFCGKNNLQLIITKKCPQIECKGDNTKEYWGFTVVRRENPSGGRRSSMYTYLANEDGSIMSFLADKLNIIPTPSGDYKPFEYGMYIKLFEYNIPGAYKTSLLLDLNFRLALLMPSLAHPVRLIECRKYDINTPELTLSGLNVRLTDDKRDNVEPGFPVSLDFDVDGQRFTASVYVFKEEANDRNYREDEGVIFTLNGQTHGSLNKTFFKRESVGLSYLANSLIIVVDCSNIDGRIREDLFMNSRDRLRDSVFKRKIERTLEENLRQHDGLRALQEERRRKAVSKRLENEKPLADVLKDIIKKSPTLSRLFLVGQRLQNPFSLSPANSSNAFNGKRHPTYFILKNKPKNGTYTKHAPINHKFRVQFETDVVNDYFCRDTDPGRFELYCMGEKYSSYSINLYNGVVTLTVKWPENAKVGDELKFKAVLVDNCIPEELSEEFIAVVEQEQNKNISGRSGERISPSGETEGGNRNKPGGLDLPTVNEIYQEEWEKYKVKKEDALIIIGSGQEGVYDFYINMDNIHLKTELKNIRDDSKVRLIRARYKYSMVLIGLSLINSLKSESAENNNKEFDIEEYVKAITRRISPVILPMIDTMGELDIDDIISDISAINETLTA